MRVNTATASLLAAVSVVLLLTLAASPARADFSFDPVGTSFSLSDHRAGAHPDLTTSFYIKRKDNGEPEANVHSFRVSLPPGIVGAVRDFPACTEDQLQRATGCPVDAQVGIASVRLAYRGNVNDKEFPVFNVVPRPGAAAQFGFTVFILAQPVRVTVRADDYGLETVAEPIAREGALAVVGSSFTLWGIPGDRSHDAQLYGFRASSPPAPRALLTNPSWCGASSAVTLMADSWEAQGSYVTKVFDIPPFTDCDRLPPLEPSARIAPASLAAGQPSAYDIDINVPQSDDPYSIATPPAKTIDVALPEGTAISPGASDGLAVCTDEQLAFKQAVAVACPDASKVGTVSIETPALKVPLTGTMYLRESSTEHRFRLALVAEGPGVLLKLPGDVTVDQRTGRVATRFDDSPQFPFLNLHVHLKGGPRALLANPPSCGTYTSTVSLTPYGGGPAGVATSQFDLSADGHGTPCPVSAPFAPGFTAGVTSPVAGASTPFTFRMTRSDADREIGSIASVKLPPGLLGDVSKVPLCDAAPAAAGTCAAATRVGKVLVGSGPGDKPLYLPGDVYLTGPYKGAAFGLSIVVRALAGPYDLGTVIVRAAVHVNRDASLRVESDALPTMIEGIPLRLRDIVLDFDRPGFMFNPTSCAPATITATAVSIDGLADPVSSRFQLGDCAALGYKPKLTMKLAGREKTGSTALTARVTTRSGDANSKRISVKLPDHLGLNVNSGVGLCSSSQLAARSCPADSIVGSASVDSILHEPLSGPVYFVQGAGGKAGSLPRLWIPLTGEGVTIDLMAQTTIEDNRIVTTFEPIPDVPFEVFDLKINGGQKGILSLERNWCTKTLTSPVQMDGHNGKVRDSTIVVPAGCPFRVVSRSLTKSRLAVKVSGLGVGTLSVKGAGIRSARKRLASATVATIAAGRTRRSAPAGVRVMFDPAGPAKAKTIRVALG